MHRSLFIKRTHYASRILPYIAWLKQQGMPEKDVDNLSTKLTTAIGALVESRSYHRISSLAARRAMLSNKIGHIIQQATSAYIKAIPALVSVIATEVAEKPKALAQSNRFLDIQDIKKSASRISSAWREKSYFKAFSRSIGLVLKVLLKLTERIFMLDGYRDSLHSMTKLSKLLSSRKKLTRKITTLKAAMHSLQSRSTARKAIADYISMHLRTAAKRNRHRIKASGWRLLGGMIKITMGFMIAASSVSILPNLPDFLEFTRAIPRVTGVPELSLGGIEIAGAMLGIFLVSYVLLKIVQSQQEKHEHKAFLFDTSITSKRYYNHEMLVRGMRSINKNIPISSLRDTLNPDTLKEDFGIKHSHTKVIVEKLIELLAEPRNPEEVVLGRKELHRRLLNLPKQTLAKLVAFTNDNVMPDGTCQAVVLALQASATKYTLHKIQDYSGYIRAKEKYALTIERSKLAQGPQTPMIEKEIQELTRKLNQLEDLEPQQHQSAGLAWLTVCEARDRALGSDQTHLMTISATMAGTSRKLRKVRGEQLSYSRENPYFRQGNLTLARRGRSSSLARPPEPGASTRSRQQVSTYNNPLPQATRTAGLSFYKTNAPSKNAGARPMPNKPAQRSNTHAQHPTPRIR